MDSNFSLTLALLIPFLLWFVGFALGVLVLWMTIRSGVRRALRDHYLWVQGNQAARADVNSPRITPTHA
ncbi:MAG: hypothetical protein ABI053_09085 [Lacisediminihabitans sp.]